MLKIIANLRSFGLILFVVVMSILSCDDDIPKDSQSVELGQPEFKFTMNDTAYFGLYPYYDTVGFPFSNQHSTSGYFTSFNNDGEPYYFLRFDYGAAGTTVENDSSLSDFLVAHMPVNKQGEIGLDEFPSAGTMSFFMKDNQDNTIVYYPVEGDSIYEISILKELDAGVGNPGSRFAVEFEFQFNAVNQSDSLDTIRIRNGYVNHIHNY